MKPAYTLLIVPLLSLACGGQTPPATNAATDGTSEAAATAPEAPAAPVRPVASNDAKPVENVLIDDFEDGNSQGLESDGRGGYWYTYKDPSSSVAPEGQFELVDGGPGESKFAAGMKGEVGNQQYPFVGMGVSFTDPKAAWDASSCKGVAFQARTASEGINTVRVKVGDWQTSPEGGLCKECFNDFGWTVQLSPEWKDYSMEFAKMRQEPYWGEPKPAIDTKALYQIQWQVSQNSRPFHIEVDNVRLIGCEGQTDLSVPPDEAPAPPAAIEVPASEETTAAPAE